MFHVNHLLPYEISSLILTQKETITFEMTTCLFQKWCLLLRLLEAILGKPCQNSMAAILFVCLFVFVALLPMSTAMVIAGR